MKCAKFLYNTLFDDELKYFKPRIFIKYKQPVNGYDVTVMCLLYNYTYDKERNTEIWGNALLYFEKEDNRFYIYNEYLQLIIPQYFISNKSGIWSLSLIVHSKG